MSDVAHHACLLARRQVVNHYQPIVDLQTGAMLGVEVLGRLTDGQTIIPPAVFLPSFGIDQLVDLLFVSLGSGLEALAACSATHPGMFMSFNISPLVMVRPDFIATLLGVLAAEHVDPARITLEILEDDEFLSVPAARSAVTELQAAGLHVALDDVGVGYSSLSRLRELAVDKIKLDQTFTRELDRKPEGLHFVSAMQSLARGLHSMLVVEGVETREIKDALGVLGVQAAQGYGIARPMPQAALTVWLALHRPQPIGRKPDSLLGAYAAHLSIVEACRALINQPMRFTWAGDIRDPHVCAIGCYFDEHGLHDTPFGQAHKAFHRIIDRHDDDPAAWEHASSELWRTMQEAIKAETARQEVPPFAPPTPPRPPAMPPRPLAMDQRAGSCFGEQLQQHRVRHAAVQDHAAFGA